MKRVKQFTKMLGAVLIVTAIAAGCGGKDEGDEPAPQPGSGAPTFQKLTEAQVVGAVLAATDALHSADSAALPVVTSPGVWRFADVLRVDHRAIGREIRAVADTMRVAGVTSPLSERLRTSAVSIATALNDTAADRSAEFVAGQIGAQRALIGAMDSILIPSSTTPALRQVLQDLRPLMVAHLQRGEQLQKLLATSDIAPRQAAARISPDSARLPGDTTADGLPVVRVKPKPDTTVRIPPDTMGRIRR
jgi:putative membrane protein